MTSYLCTFCFNDIYHFIYWRIKKKKDVHSNFLKFNHRDIKDSLQIKYLFSYHLSRFNKKNLKMVSNDNLAANLHPDINSLRLIRTRIFSLIVQWVVTKTQKQKKGAKLNKPTQVLHFLPVIIIIDYRCIPQRLMMEYKCTSNAKEVI